MTEFCHAFERLDETDASKRFVFLTSDEFEFFFSDPDHRHATKALAWSEFYHSVAGRMTKVPMDKAKAEANSPPQ